MKSSRELPFEGTKDFGTANLHDQTVKCTSIAARAVVSSAITSIIIKSSFVRLPRS